MKSKNTTVFSEEEFFLRLSKAYQLSRKWAEQIIRGFGFTLAEYNLLRIIQNNTRISARQAQGRLFATAPSIAQLVRSLERKGLMKREQSKHDARVQHMELTKKGEELIEEACTIITKTVQKMPNKEKFFFHLSRDLNELISFLSFSSFS